MRIAGFLGICLAVVIGIALFTVGSESAQPAKDTVMSVMPDTHGGPCTDGC